MHLAVQACRRLCIGRLTAAEAIFTHSPRQTKNSATGSFHARRRRLPMGINSGCTRPSSTGRSGRSSNRPLPRSSELIKCERASKNRLSFRRSEFANRGASELFI
jgi:hypothetical protein